MVKDNNVGILYLDKIYYPKLLDGLNWFRPSENYIEFQNTMFSELSIENKVYDGVRNLFRLYEMDIDNYGTEKWNPLGEIIHPGNTVLLKPNMVMDHNQTDGGIECLYTQPSVVAPVIDYVYKALEGKGKIIIGDAPMQECDFDKLVNESGYGEILDYYKKKGVNIELIDFRGLVTKVSNGGMVRNQQLREGVKGTVIDLKNVSSFSEFDSIHLDKMRITNYDPARLKSHHSVGKHEYYIADSVLQSDVIINMPKPKTHRKAGYTAAMKNVVGINVRKEYLPHHSNGSVIEGGDEHRKRSLLRNIGNVLLDKKNHYEALKIYSISRIYWLFANGCIYIAGKIHRDIHEGNWYGNNTISKTIVDLNKIINYCDKKGIICEQKQRQIFTIADMIISGQKEGPVAPSPKEVGALVISLNSYAADCAIGTMMGADINRMPFIKDTNKCNDTYSLLPVNKEIKILSNDELLNGRLIKNIENQLKWNFVPVEGWKEIFNVV